MIRRENIKDEIRSGATADPRDGDGAEVGLVPAWCFIKPTEGGPPAERPKRGSSLGVALQVEAQRKQDHVVDWSRFV